MSIPASSRVVAAVVLAAALSGVALAQEVTGSLSGAVEDQQGQAIPGATVTAVNQRTASSRVDHTDGKGNFLFTAMPPGTYTIRVEMPNFRTVEQKLSLIHISEPTRPY